MGGVPDSGGTERRGSGPDLFLLVLVNVLWGSTYVVARGVLESAPPLVLAFTRFLVASLWMASFGCHRPAPASGSLSHSGAAREKPAPWWLLPLIGTAGFGLAKLLCYEGLARSTATDAALIINLEAVFTALLGAVLLDQAIRRAHVVGLVIAFLGGAALVWPENGGGAAAGTRALGNLLMVGSVAAEALASVLGARATRTRSGLQVTAIATYWGTAFLFPLALWQWRASRLGWSWLTPWNGAALLYLALAATVLAYGLWFRVLARVDAGRVATFLYLQPLIGLLLGLAIRHEIPTRLGWAGGVLVVCGIWVANREDAGGLNGDGARRRQ